MEELTLYQCHKQVHARLITKGAYLHCYNKEPTPSDDISEEGYLVIYSKGTGNEYISWSPKKVFEDGYTEMEATIEE